MSTLRTLIKLAALEGWTSVNVRKKIAWQLWLRQLKKEGKIRTVKQAINWFEDVFGGAPGPLDRRIIRRIMRG